MQLLQTIENLLAERAPYKRNGYPRAGGFDRLAIMALYNSPASDQQKKRLLLRYWLPAPRMLYTHDLILEGEVASLVMTKATEQLQGLVIVAQRHTAGTLKYGQKNKHFAELEQGIFLQALHMALCQKKMPNHMQGELNLEQLPLSLPPDFDKPIGIVV